MNLQELKSLLLDQGDKFFRLKLPCGTPMPESFHVTEVGRVQKTFIDCGGTMRKAESCQLQAWVGEDEDHRILASTAAAILEKANALMIGEAVPVEIEYEDDVISQYAINGYESDDVSIVLQLGYKHTDCLAKEICCAPRPKKASEESCCCGPGCC